MCFDDQTHDANTWPEPSTSDSESDSHRIVGSPSSSSWGFRNEGVHDQFLRV